jgi:Protein of unknown function (DUF4197)
MTDFTTNRRQLLAGGIGLSAVALLPGCAAIPGFSMVDAIRELLSYSSQSAFARLVQPGGFYDTQISRLDVPSRFNGGGVVAQLLQSGPFKSELQKQINHAAEKGAERAAPLVLQAISSVSIADAASLIRGGPTSATDFLRGEMRGALIDTMVPGISDAMRLFGGSSPLGQVLNSLSGANLTSAIADVSTQADNAIWQSIGVEESLVRANPQKTGNPTLIAVLGAGKLF